VKRPRDGEAWRPVAYVALRDQDLRARVVEALRAEGWAVIDSASGYHLVRGISGLILGDRPWIRPGLVVADALSPGCSGLSIARGLRELGLAVPVALVADRGGEDPAPGVYLLEPAFAVDAIAALARRSGRVAVPVPRRRAGHAPPARHQA
jgi:hypothetical protein